MLTISLPSVVDEIARQEAVVGVFLGGMGLVFILMGLRMSRLLVGLSFGVLGFVIGACIVGLDSARVVAGLLTGLALGAASLWALRPSVAILAGFWAGLAVLQFLKGMHVDPQMTLVVSGASFLAVAALAFVTVHELTALVTSLEGTLMFLGGLIVLCNQNAIAWSHLRGLLVSNPIFAPFLVVAGTIAGFYAQMAELQKKQTGQSG